MNVLKFGGTSVANAQNISLVKNIVYQNAYTKQYVVVSALGGITDLLLDTAAAAANQDPLYKTPLNEIEKRHLDTVKSLIAPNDQSAILSQIKAALNTLETLLEGAYLIGEITPKLSDKIVSFGELLSSYIISAYFKSQGLDAIHADARTLITTDQVHGKASVNYALTNQKLLEFNGANKNAIVVMGGFIASSSEGVATTLGRGGSDFSAALIAAATNASELQIWTDVSGMFTANPRVVKQAFPISEISYEEAMELSHFGAKVLYPPTIQPALRKEIPIRIKNTFNPKSSGTLICKDPKNSNEVKGISHIEDISLITLEGGGMIGIPGFSKRLFETLSQQKINVVFITQASSEHSICVGVYENDASKAKDLLDETFNVEIERKKIKPIIIENDLAIIAVVGESMKNYQGLSGQMFSALGRNNVNVRAIAQGSSEKNISAVINKYDAKKALNTLHEQFFEEKTKQLNLFITGVGNVGERLLAQLQQQKKFLKDKKKKLLKIKK